MKTIILSFALFLTADFAQAAILRCNNNPSVTGANIYTTAQAAHDAASVGDTIHLEPTLFGNYGGLSVTKKIVLISTGDFIEQNQNTQASVNTGQCGNINMQTGSENSVISAKVNGSIYIYTSYINIEYSSVGGEISVTNGYYGLPIHDIAILKNFLSQYINIASSYGTSAPYISNVFISNNITGYLAVSQGCSALISNNIISYPSSSLSVHNSSIDNNIFLNNQNFYYYFYNSIGSNNLVQYTNGGSMPSGTNNQVNVDMSTVFQNWNAFSGENYQLLASYSNQNVGIFGGSNPYKIACQPAVPAIYQLSIPTSSNGSILPIQVSTKSNN